jgi:hypothetical protein
MAEYRDLDSFSSGLGPSRTRLSSLRTNRKVIGQPIPMIVADARQCWSAAESRACTLQPISAPLAGEFVNTEAQGARPNRLVHEAV